MGLELATGEITWDFEIGNEGCSTPAFHDRIIYIGSSDGFVYALDAGSGHLQWASGTGAPVISSPAVVDDTVYRRRRSTAISMR